MRLFFHSSPPKYCCYQNLDVSFSEFLIRPQLVFALKATFQIPIQIPHAKHEEVRRICRRVKFLHTKLGKCFHHRLECKFILQVSISIVCNSCCNNVHLCFTHTCKYLRLQASKKQVCVSADINHFSTAAVCRSIYPHISLLKSPSNHHVASQPGCLSKFSGLYVFVWQHMFALVFKRMCKCTGCLAANVGLRERVSVSECVIIGITSTY